MISKQISVICAGAALVLMMAAGCDTTGQYDKKIAQALDEAKRRSVFEDNLHQTVTEIFDTARQPVGRIRLPKLLDAQSKVLQQSVIPGLAGLPAPTYSLMKELDDDSGQTAPLIMAIFVGSKADQKSEPMLNVVAKLMAGVSPAAKWEDVSLPAPSGQQVNLKRIRSESQTQVPGAKGKATTVNSRIDVYGIDSSGHSIAIAWLMPKAQAQKHNLERAIEASMGTVELNAPAGEGPAAAGGKAPGCF